MRGCFATGVAVGVLLGLGVAGPAFARTSAEGASSPEVATSALAAAGSPGYCASDVGVTVVVDLTALGGDVVVRCAQGSVEPGFTGLDALQGAGFSVTGTQRFGLAFVCRIQGSPAADTAVAIPGNPDYHEQCRDTPPWTAYWGYWYAPNGGRWTYSSGAGAEARDVIAGGFEGWAFSLGEGSPPQPALEPRRPEATPSSVPPPATTPTPPPRRHHAVPISSTPISVPSGGGPAGHAHASASALSRSTRPTTSPPPGTSAPVGTASPPTHAGQSDSGVHGPAAPSTATRSPAPDRKTPAKTARGTVPPTAQPAPTSAGPTGVAGSGVEVTGDLPDTGAQSVGSSRATVLGAGLLVLIGLGAGLTAWRRSHRT